MEDYDAGLPGQLYENQKPEKEERKKPKKSQPVRSLYSDVKESPIRTISKLVSITSNAMKERQLVWNRYRTKYRRGLRYLAAGSTGVPLFFTNYIYATIESVKANLTRNLPSISAIPRGARDDLAAELMSRVLSDSLNRGGLREATREVVHHGLITALSYYKVFYSDQTDGLSVCAIPPDDLLVDPTATKIDDARWVIHRRRNVPDDEIYATYGSVPTTSDLPATNSIGAEFSVDDDSTYISSGELRSAHDVSRNFDVYECWIRCWEQDRPNDWYVVVAAGDTVLDEYFSPYNHNKTPFVEWVAAEDYCGDNIYYRGSGYVEEIEPLQDRVDSIDLKIYKNTSLLSNRQRYVSANSGLNVNTMDNTAGRAYKVNGDPSKAVYYDAPPQMSQAVYDYRDRTEMLIQTVSGVYDVTMGRRPTGITAGRAIESLKDAAETRLASVADTLAAAIERVADLGLQIILQFYDGARIIKATDANDGKDFVIVDDYPQELQPTPPMQMDDFGMPMTNPETGEPMLEETDEEPEVSPELEEQRKQWKEQTGVALVLSEVTFKWDIEASTDSALPSARAERGQVASDLFRLGAIDREALLTSLDWPDRHKILARLAAEATGKNAGDPNVDTTDSQVQQIFQMLQQMGLPEEAIQQMQQQIQQGAQQPQQPQGGGNFPPQMVM